MKTIIPMILFALSLAANPVYSEPKLNQLTTTSWQGLSGLFVIPTARTLNAKNISLGFNESKHTEFRNDGKFTDRQIRGVLTYGITDSLEIYASYYNNLYTIPSGVEPQLENNNFSSFGFKWRFLNEKPGTWIPTIALGIRDIANSTADAGPLQDVGNGRKYFLLASKQVLRNTETGRFLDIHFGVASDSNTVSGLAGFELTLTPNASLIAEWMSDSPYLDFKNYGLNNNSGRFVFNPGIRIYPELVPGLVLDMGFIGDSEFEFSFGISYVANR